MSRRVAPVTLCAVSTLAVSGVWACRASTAPPATTIPRGLVQRTVIAGRVNVCTVGPAGSYIFSISATGGVTGGRLPLGPTVTIAAGNCADVWVATPTSRDPDPATLVTVAPLSFPPDAMFGRIVSAETDDRGYTLQGDHASFMANMYHGGATTYYFVAR